MDLRDLLDPGDQRVRFFICNSADIPLLFFRMKFLSFFFRQLQPAWSHSAPHTLWRVIFSHSGSIVCEERNTDEKIVTFSCIDARSGQLYWSNRNFGEQWWIGIEGITNDRLYMHGFRKPDMPEHLGIICADLRSGEILWKNMNCSFLTIHNTDLYGFKDLFERRLYYNMDQQTGSMIEELQTLPASVEENIQLEKTDFTFPQPMMHEQNEMLRGIVSDTARVQRAEFVQTEKFQIVNFYTHHSDPSLGLKNTLSIIDSAIKKKVYSDVLNESTPYPVPDSFFMDGNRLYYIRERRSLVAVDVPY